MHTNKRKCDITEEFIDTNRKRFYTDNANIIARNAIASVGCQFSTINADRANQLSHVFLNSIKKRNLRATNQGQSGRCWMFAALNTFRHAIINTLELTNFEFSETYLFFWDKLERCNTYLMWFIDNPNESYESRAYDHMVNYFLSDGGWWDTFANLADKYGLIPKEAMAETASSGDSEEMNHIIKEQIDCCVNQIIKKRNTWSTEKLIELKNTTMSNIYNTLVKFLGAPPQTFKWSYTTDEDDCNIVRDLTPAKFTELLLPKVKFCDEFVQLVNIPTKNYKMYQKYSIKNTSNIYNGNNCTVINVPIDELTKYATKTISAGLAVWFAADMSQSFNWFHSALDDELDDHEKVFNLQHKFTDKGERLLMRNIQSNHAMALTGFNVDHNNRVINWQVENSWGYWDNETPGLDGFLTMSHSWFTKYVTGLVVPRKFLSRKMTTALNTQPIEVEPWSSLYSVARIRPSVIPHGYIKLMEMKKKSTI